MKILVFGGTGFVGKNLVDFLKNEHDVTVVSRRNISIGDKVTIIQADLSKDENLDFIKEYDVIYYLVHAMDSQGDYEAIEKKQAQKVASFLLEGQKIIYLSGLAQADELSKHMRSRHQVGEAFRSSKAITIEIRASIVIGEGSLSFEMIRAIVERFPVILEASWSKTKCEPIYIEDLLKYLSQSIELIESKIIEVGGCEVVEYVELLKMYAQIVQLKRPTLKIKQFPINVVGNIMSVFLPEYEKVGRNLLQSIDIESTVRTTDYQEFHISARTIEFAMRESIKKGQRKWEQVSFEQLINHEQFQDIKQNFASSHLLDHYEFFVPFPKVYLKKALDSFLKLYNINPFKKFTLVDFSLRDDHYELVLKTKLIKEFKTAIIFSEIDAVTKVEIINQYGPKTFLDAVTYVAGQKFGQLVIETIQKFLPK